MIDQRPGSRAAAALPGLHAPAAGFDAPFALLDACHERVRRSLALLERLGAISHWSRFRERWFVPQARGALVLLALPYVLPGVQIAGFGRALVAALVLGLINALIRPIVLLLTLPINLLTLGLFTLVVNGVVLMIVAAVTALNVAGFGAAIVGALILTVISWVLDAVVNALGLDGGRD